MNYESLEDSNRNSIAAAHLIHTALELREEDAELLVLAPQPCDLGALFGLFIIVHWCSVLFRCTIYEYCKPFTVTIRLQFTG